MSGLLQSGIAPLAAYKEEMNVWEIKLLQELDHDAAPVVGYTPLKPWGLLVYNDKESYLVSVRHTHYFFLKSGPGPLTAHNGRFMKCEPGEVCEFNFPLEDVYPCTAQEADAFLQAESDDALGCNDFWRAKAIDKLREDMRQAKLI